MGKTPIGLFTLRWGNLCSGVAHQFFGQLIKTKT